MTGTTVIVIPVTTFPAKHKCLHLVTARPDCRLQYIQLDQINMK